MPTLTFVKLKVRNITKANLFTSVKWKEYVSSFVKVRVYVNFFPVKIRVYINHIHNEEHINSKWQIERDIRPFSLNFLSVF